jgi:hypothetical protein
LDFLFLLIGILLDVRSSLSSDLLLAIVVIGCGAIGSVMGGLRSERRLTTRLFSLGLAAGFVTFLTIKGGRYVFLVQSEGPDIAFNPYSSAFLGIVVGLFTDRVHQLLSDLVDQFIERLRTAIG